MYLKYKTDLIHNIENRTNNKEGQKNMNSNSKIRKRLKNIEKDEST